MSIVEIFGNALLFVAAVIMIAVWPFTEFARGMADASAPPRSKGGCVASLAGLALLGLLVWSWLK